MNVNELLAQSTVILLLGEGLYSFMFPSYLVGNAIWPSEVVVLEIFGRNL